MLRVNAEQGHQAALCPGGSGRPCPLLVGCWQNPLFMGQSPSVFLPKPLPASRAPENLVPEPLHPASTGNLGPLADPWRLPGYLSDLSYQCDLP